MDFFETVFGNGEGCLAVATISPETGGPSDQIFYQWPQDRAHLNRFLNSASSFDVYFSPILFKEERRIIPNAKEVAVVYADADTCDPDEFRVTPSISVETSPGRWHCYWVLDTTYDPKLVSQVAHKIAIAHRPQGCDISGWHRTKLLRVPGTSNTKYDDAFVVTPHYTGLIYTLEEIDLSYEDISLEGAPQEFDSSTLDNFDAELLDLEPLLERIPAKGEIAGLYSEDWATRPDGTTDRSERRWALIQALLEAGFTPVETATVVWHSRVNKYRDLKRPVKDLFKEVFKAATGRSNIPLVSAEVEPLKEPESIREYENADLRKVEFLTEREREFLPKTFVEDYADWVATRTDSPRELQIANAVTVLSAVLSDIAFIVPQAGATGLNVWTLTAAPTTESRKSTSRDLMIDLLHAAERACIGYQVDIGSDVTKESLQGVLAERDGLTSLVHKDEVHGFFRTQKVKSYQQGDLEFYTDLYGGRVPTYLRANKENKGSGKRVTTNLLLHFMGTPSEIAAELDIASFRSGFLARFIYLMTDHVDMTREREYMGQASADEKGNIIDPLFSALVKRISNMRARHRRPTGPWAIRMTQDALDRWNAFKYDMGVEARKSRFEVAVEPSRQRLAISTWKIAALLALSNGEQVITLQYVLKAISFAEHWFANLVKMASMISASEWEFFIDKIESLVQARGKVSTEAVHKQFPERRKREMEEAYQSLISQGRIEEALEPKTGKKYLISGKES